MTNPTRSRWQFPLLLGVLMVLGLLAIWAMVEAVILESEADQVVQEARSNFRSDRFEGVAYLSAVIQEADARGFSESEVERFEKTKSDMVKEMKREKRYALGVDVQCDGPVACRTLADESFQEAKELLSSDDEDLAVYAAASAKLILTHLFLIEGEIWEVPREFDGWDEMIRKARETLDLAFREFRMRFYQALTREQTDRARQILDEVKTTFPVEGSFEHRWATHQEEGLESAGSSL
ncbi:MAG: hypothetical protein ACNA8W_15850 [Bradymonadaceae bacterium]